VFFRYCDKIAKYILFSFFQLLNIIYILGGGIDSTRCNNKHPGGHVYTVRHTYTRTAGDHLASLNGRNNTTADGRASSLHAGADHCHTLGHTLADKLGAIFSHKAHAQRTAGDIYAGMMYTRHTSAGDLLASLNDSNHTTTDGHASSLHAGADHCHTLGHTLADNIHQAATLGQTDHGHQHTQRGNNNRQERHQQAGDHTTGTQATAHGYSLNNGRRLGLDLGGDILHHGGGAYLNGRNLNNGRRLGLDNQGGRNVSNAERFTIAGK
jgi:hypothetical protein